MLWFILLNYYLQDLHHVKYTLIITVKTIFSFLYPFIINLSLSVVTVCTKPISSTNLAPQPTLVAAGRSPLKCSPWTVGSLWLFSKPYSYKVHSYHLQCTIMATQLIDCSTFFWDDTIFINIGLDPVSLLNCVVHVNVNSQRVKMSTEFFKSLIP